MNMDFDYFKDHIQDELCGAMEYVKAALEIRAANPEWSDKFQNMCSQELVHAKNFYDMFQEYYDTAVRPYTEIPKYFREQKTEIIDLYSEGYGKVKWLQEMLVNKR